MNPSKSNHLIIDTFCIDSFIYCIIKGFLSKYEYIVYCRVTLFGKFIISFLHHFTNTKILCVFDAPQSSLQGDLSFNEYREELVSKAMLSVDHTHIDNIAHILNIPLHKVNESFRVYSWKAFYYPAEAITRAHFTNSDHLIEIVYNIKFELGYYSPSFTRYVDCSPIVARNDYLFDRSEETQNPFIAFVVSFIRYILFVVFLPFSLISHLFKNSSVSSDDRPIAVQALKNFADIKVKGDFFWIFDTNILSKSILIERSKVNFLHDFPDLLEVKLFHSIQDIFNGKSILLDFKLSLIFIKTIYSFARLSFVVFFCPPLRIFSTDLYKSLLYFSIFKHYSTKVLITKHAYYNASLLFSCAMANVVYLRTVGSNNPRPHPRLATSADIFFSWGVTTTDIYIRSGASHTTFVHTGFVDDVLYIKEPTRKAYPKSDKAVTLLFFDNLFSSDLVNSLEDLSSCFSMLYRLLQKHQKLVIMYKPKSGTLDQINLCLGKIIVDELISLKRLIPITGIRTYGNSPAEFAYCSDIVLGYPISSAVFEVSMYKRSGFHMNLTSQREHLWESNTDARQFIFYSIDYAESLLSYFIDDINRIPTLPDSLISTINYFDDFNAKFRMQYYIESLCSSTESSLKSRINQANALYTHKFSSNLEEPLITYS